MVYTGQCVLFQGLTLEGLITILSTWTKWLRIESRLADPARLVPCCHGGLSDLKGDRALFAGVVPTGGLVEHMGLGVSVVWA